MKQKVIELLESTKREGMKGLIGYMDEKKFWTSPGSTKFHSAFEGGLMSHSLRDYNLFNKLIEMSKFVDFPKDSRIICGILHDLCKAGMYFGNAAPYKYNKANGEGHAKLSLERIERFIKLTEDERDVIKYHMGNYGTVEFATMQGWGKGEYTLKELMDIWNKKKLVKVFYFSDDLSTQLFEKRM